MYPLKIKEKYNPSNLDNLGHRFSTVHLGNYIREDRREYVGSHPGVDIIPEYSNQEVLCVLDGDVVKVGDDGAYGLFVNVKHTNVPDPDDFSKKTNLVSCYLHLDKLKVKEGDKIKEGTVLGVTGNTGMSYGEHLHFQIDREEAPYHAYWPYSGADIRKAGISFLEGVNRGLGLENAKKLTVNPLVYLDKLEEFSNNTKKTITSQEDEKLGVKKEDVNIDIPQKNTQVIESVKETINSSEEKLEKIIEKEEIVVSKRDVVSSSNTITNTNGVDNWLNNIGLGNNSKNEVKKDNPSINQKDLKLVVEREKINHIDAEIISNPSEVLFSNDFNNNQQQAFKDINSTDNIFGFLNELHKKGIVKGYDDGTFRPGNPITRSEFLKLIFEVKGVDLASDNTNYFLDVNPNTWQKSYINTGVKLGLITTANKEFRPNSYISRVEALKIIIMLFEGGYPNTNYKNNYTDVQADLWFAPFVAYSDNKGLIVTSGNNFFPNKNITRREVVYMLSKLA